MKKKNNFRLPPADVLWPSAFHCENCEWMREECEWTRTRQIEITAVRGGEEEGDEERSQLLSKHERCKTTNETKHVSKSSQSKINGVVMKDQSQWEVKLMYQFGIGSRRRYIICFPTSHRPIYPSYSHFFYSSCECMCPVLHYKECRIVCQINWIDYKCDTGYNCIRWIKRRSYNKIYRRIAVVFFSLSLSCFFQLKSRRSRELELIYDNCYRYRHVTNGWVFFRSLK